MRIMLVAAAALMTLATACSSDDPLSEDNSYSNIIDGNSSSSASSGSTAISTYAEMKSFTIAIDKTTAEPESAAAAQYPADGDAPGANTFSTLVNIDMSNPKDPAIEGVTITIDGNNVTANHGSTEGVCYVVTGKTTDGSLIINGNTNFELNLNGADITSASTTAIDIEGAMPILL